MLVNTSGGPYDTESVMETSTHSELCCIITFIDTLQLHFCPSPTHTGVLAESERDVFGMKGAKKRMSEWDFVCVEYVCRRRRGCGISETEWRKH